MLCLCNLFSLQYEQLPLFLQDLSNTLDFLYACFTVLLMMFNLGTKRGIEPQNPSVVTCQLPIYRLRFSPVLSSLPFAPYLYDSLLFYLVNVGALFVSNGSLNSSYLTNSLLPESNTTSTLPYRADQQDNCV